MTMSGHPGMPGDTESLSTVNATVPASGIGDAPTMSGHPGMPGDIEARSRLGGTGEPPSQFLGLAPFLRLSIAGADLQAVAAELLARAQDAPDDACAWMNLATVMQCLGLSAMGLEIQAQALAIQRLYCLPAARRPASLRLLVLMAPGDLDSNTPIDCLLEGSDIDLLFYHATLEAPLPDPLPAHDALLVAIADAPARRPLLAALDARLADWPCPVLNAPGRIPNTDREQASLILRQAPGLLMPPTRAVARADLATPVDSGASRLSAGGASFDFPIILRPLGSQAGRDLARIENATQLADYLSQVPASDFFLSPFVDYRGPDGFWRKCRVALVDGEPFACHLAVSAHWMVHYVNAGMYQEAWKREEEAVFMADFDRFAHRHRQALAAIHEAAGLDYLCLDCAEMPDGRLLLFEMDHAMVVHAMDPPALFPYKEARIAKARDALRALLRRRIAAIPANPSTPEWKPEP